MREGKGNKRVDGKSERRLTGFERMRCESEEQEEITIWKLRLCTFYNMK